nr:unnamed protein product [Digitaria exilis]
MAAASEAGRGRAPAATTTTMTENTGGFGGSWEYKLRKYILLLATLVATVTYGAAFNPPGGVWQDAAGDVIAGDPIIRKTSYARYLAFFYSNAVAFASSLVVTVLILVLSILHDRGEVSLEPLLAILRLVMVLDLLSLMGAYAAGTFRDRLTAIYSLLLLAGVVVYLAAHSVLAARLPDDEEDDAQSANKKRDIGRLRKVPMLLATFAVSVTYVAGLSAPGGFWDHEEGGHKPGSAVLKGGPHDKRLKAFFVCNTTAFVSSLLILVILLEKKLLRLWNYELHGFTAVTLLGLVAAYVAGSSRETDTTIYVSSLVGAVVVCVLVQVAFVILYKNNENVSDGNCLWRHLKSIFDAVSKCLGYIKRLCLGKDSTSPTPDDEQEDEEVLERARSLVLLLATLAAAITYQAGLNPPGGLWQADGDGYMAGDPILSTTYPRRYKAFFYCNSVGFVASLISIILVRMKTLHHHNALEAAMILDLFGLMGAYAAGSCRDVSTSVYAMALGGAVLIYVVIHVVFLTLDPKHAAGVDEELVEKIRKRFLIFAILAATITYQAGLTPPGGFLLKGDTYGHHAGDPVLLYNYPRRYTAFFYCNSVSFMLSIALIILLVNPILYRPAIRSNALSVCTAAGISGLMGAYAAGCTQHIKTSMYIFALAGFVLFVLAAAVVWAIRKKPPGQNTTQDKPKDTAEDKKEKELYAKSKYLMLLGILAASVTYQAGLTPPGGSWQSNDSKHIAGDPVMRYNRRDRYLAFFYSNSTSFVASVVVIILLLPPSLHKKPWWLGVMKTTVVLDLLGLLIAYAAGSSRTGKTTGYVSMLVVPVLAYFAIHVGLSCFNRKYKNRDGSTQHLRGAGSV